MINMEIVWTLVGLVGLLLLDTILGASVALKRGDFSWSELARTLKSNMLPYIVSLGALGGLASYSRAGPAEAMTAFFATFAGLYTLKLVSDIAAKVKELFGVEVN